MSDGMFLVQKDGLRLPEIKRAPKQPRRKFPVEGMEPGDKFFVPGKTSKSVSAYISRITKDLPGRYSARHDWARRAGEVAGKPRWVSCSEIDKGAVEGVTVARIE